MQNRCFVLTCRDRWRDPTHAGIPWLRFIRQGLGARVHCWPFDGWDIPAGRFGYIAAWLSRADRDGSLAAFLKPDLTPTERAVGRVEGWILGVPGLIHAGKEREGLDAPAACDPNVFRLH